MLEVNVTLLREHLPEYLARVERCKSVRVARHGKVVAEIRPHFVAEEGLGVNRVRLLGRLVLFEDPLAPVIGEGEWDMRRGVLVTAGARIRDAGSVQTAW